MHSDLLIGAYGMLQKKTYIFDTNFLPSKTLPNLPIYESSKQGGNDGESKKRTG